MTDEIGKALADFTEKALEEYDGLPVGAERLVYDWTRREYRKARPITKRTPAKTEVDKFLDSFVVERVGRGKGHDAVKRYDAVYDALRNGPLTKRQIADATGYSPSAVYDTLRRERSTFEMFYDNLENDSGPPHAYYRLRETCR